jgi:plastocyanin
MPDDNLLPVGIGLAVGVVLIVIVSLIFDGQSIPLGNKFSLVVIPNNATGTESSFEPKIIKVVIDVNNTVRWVNQDTVPAMIEADNDSDPDFYNVTKGFVFIMPNKTFEYTFTKVGEFGYHGKPWQHGTVIVLSHP